MGINKVHPYEQAEKYSVPASAYNDALHPNRACDYDDMQTDHQCDGIFRDKNILQ